MKWYICEYDDGTKCRFSQVGWYIQYRNSEWDGVTEKGVFVTSLEHHNKFVELLQEAGYQEVDKPPTQS